MMDELAHRLARGETAAYAELYDACAASLFQYLVFRLRRQDDAREVLQETFLRLVRSRKSLAKVEDLKAYVFTVARNEARRFAVRLGNRSESTPTDECFVCADNTQSHDMKELIASSLARLNESEAEVIELKIYSQLTFREIAQVLDLPQGTVATRYRTAIGRLRGWLAKEFS